MLLADGAAPHLLFAAAYDGVARVYDVRGRRGAEVAVLAPKRGKAPALCAAWTPSTAVVGDRGGAATCYDVERCAAVASLKPAGAAAGHCVALEALEEMHGDLVVTGHQDGVIRRAGQESEIPNFKSSYLGRFPLVSADFWTSDHLSERSRSMDAFFGTRARGTLTLKRR